jgi:hypothetical protein
MFIYCSKHRRLPPAHALAGVDDLLTKCHDYGRRMFALYEAGAVTGRTLVSLLPTVLSDSTLQFRVSS